MKKFTTTRRLIYLVIFILFLLTLYIFYKYILSLTFSIYEKNIYDAPTFNQIKSICDNIPREQMHPDNKATGRLMYTFPTTDTNFYSLVYNQNFIKKVRDLTGNQSLIPCLQVPVEYRKYTIGSYMDWHRDTQMLPDQLQYECVITLENTSDSLTILDKLIYKQNISSEPNSLTIVCAKGINHKVTPTSQGERTILKVVFCKPSPSPSPHLHPSSQITLWEQI